MLAFDECPSPLAHVAPAPRPAHSRRGLAARLSAAGLAEEARHGLGEPPLLLAPTRSTRGRAGGTRSSQQRLGRDSPRGLPATQCVELPRLAVPDDGAASDSRGSALLLLQCVTAGAATSPRQRRDFSSRNGATCAQRSRAEETALVTNVLPCTGPSDLPPPQQLLRVALCHLRATGRLPFVVDVHYLSGHALLTIAPMELPGRVSTRPTDFIPTTTVRVVVAVAQRTCSVGAHPHTVHRFPPLAPAAAGDGCDGAIVIALAAPTTAASTAHPHEPTFLERCAVQVALPPPPLDPHDPRRSRRPVAALGQGGGWSAETAHVGCSQHYAPFDISEPQLLHCLRAADMDDKTTNGSGGEGDVMLAHANGLRWFSWARFHADLVAHLARCVRCIWHLPSPP